jgi:predicted esterase
VSVPKESFDADRARVFALHEERRFAEALALAEEIAARHPDRPAETTFWRACLLCLLGRTEEALGAFRAALDRGVWWSRDGLDRDPDLEPLRPLSGFAEVLARSDANLAGARSGFPDHPEVLLHLPAGPPSSLLLVMHMLGATAHATEPYWRPAAELGAAVALVGSSQTTTDGQPSWELDDLVVRDLGLARDAAVRGGVPSSTPVVLAGASQGGRRAIGLSIDGRVPSIGFIAVVPGVPLNEHLAPHLESAATRGIRGWILTGEHDQEAAAAERLHRELTRAGLEVRFELVAGLGHEYPADFPARLPAALDAVVTARGG